MSVKSSLILSLIVALLIKVAWASGSIEGHIPLPPVPVTEVPVEKYLDKISGKVAAFPPIIAGVWLESAGLKAPRKTQPVIFGQTHYQFDHSLLVIPKGTTVVFPNNDPDYHNIFSLSRTKRFDLGRYKKDEQPAPTVLFDRVGFVIVRCEIHDHMKANILVVDSPYFTTTDVVGRFSFKAVPPGDYVLHAQVSRKKSWKKAVTVTTGKIVNIRFDE